MRYPAFFVMMMFFVGHVVHAKLVSYHSFDDGIGESGQSALRVYGSVDLAEGIIGQCLDLSNAGDNAVILENSQALTSGAQAFTVSLWYKGLLRDNAAGASIVSKNGQGKQGWQIQYFDKEGGACFTVGGARCSGSSPIADGKWHHIAGVKENRFLCLYVDGVLEDVTDAPAETRQSASPVVIGATIADSNEPSNFSKGLIDEVRVYDEATDQSEIKLLADKDRIIGKGFADRYRQLGVFPVQLHRGGGISLPENTLETFEWAWSQHVIPEADVRMTADKAIVCFHDVDLSRVCADESDRVKEQRIDQMTLDEVKEIDAGSFRGEPGQSIPTLEEVFEAMKGRPQRFLFLDYKYIDMNRLAEMVKKYRIEKQVIFTSRSHNLIMQYKQLVPSAQTMLWTGGTQEVISRKLGSLRLEDFKGITIMQMHYRKDDSGYSLTDEFITGVKDELAKRGIILQILPWRINEPSVFEKLMDMQITSFATDYPESVLPLYNQKLSAPSEQSEGEEKNKQQTGAAN